MLGWFVCPNISMVTTSTSKAAGLENGRSENKDIDYTRAIEFCFMCAKI